MSGPFPVQGLLNPTEDELSSIRQQNLWGALSQAGNALMVAGSPMQDSQRLPYLLSALGAFGNVPDANESAVDRLQARKLRQLQMDRMASTWARENEAAQAVLANVDKLPEGVRNFARSDPLTFGKMQAQAALEASNRRPTESEVRFNHVLNATGGNRELASAITAGLVDISKDENGAPIVINKATGAVTPLMQPAGGSQQDRFGVGVLNPQQQRLFDAAQSQPGRSMPAAGNMPVPGMPSVQPGTDAGNTPGAPQPAQGGGLDYSGIWGLPGMYRAGAGRVQDLFQGRMTSDNAGAASASADYNVLRNGLLKSLSEGMPGRESKALVDRISKLLPEPGGFTGPSMAHKQLSAVQDELDAALARGNAILNAPGYSRNDKAKAAESMQSIAQYRMKLGEITNSIAQGAQPQQSQPSGAPQGMPPNARQAPDGRYYVPDQNRPGKYLRVD